MKHIAWCTLSFAVLLFSEAHLFSAERTWIGASSTDWFDAGNWTGGDDLYPQTDDTVIIPSGAFVLLTNETAALAAFSITNATLTFSNWNTRLRATTIHVWKNGNLTHSAIDTNAAPGVTHRVCLVATDVTIHDGGKIEVNGRGFAALQGPGAGPNNQGGGYGGRGGSGGVSGGGGPTYGSTNAPTDPGSGGGVTAGGGLVWIEAPTGDVRIDGNIQANGITTTGRGAGSGGGIRIEARTIRGTGSLTATGGNAGAGGNRWGGGGGGRMALIFDATAQSQVDPRPALTYSTLGGLDSDTKRSEDGTLFVTDPVIFAPNVTLTAFLYSDGTAWNADRLTFRQGDIVITPGIALTVTGDLTVSNGVVRYQFGDGEPDALSIGGNLVFTNTASLYLYAGATNASQFAYGGLLDLTGRILNIPAGCALYVQSEPTDGGAIRIRAAEVSVATGGAINANGRGYGSQRGPGGSALRATGASHGGRGGNGGPDPYGYAFAPAKAGSGGWDSAGGGLIWIEAATVRVDGDLHANGITPSSACGTSGGGIVLVCRSLEGGGTLYANGGNGTGGGSNYGGGGGGRIAVLDVSEERFALMRLGETARVELIPGVPDEWTGRITVNGGASPSGNRNGDAGSVMFAYEDASGSVFLIL